MNREVVIIPCGRGNYSVRYRQRYTYWFWSRWFRLEPEEDHYMTCEEATEMANQALENGVIPGLSSNVVHPIISFKSKHPSRYIFG